MKTDLSHIIHAEDVSDDMFEDSTRLQIWQGCASEVMAAFSGMALPLASLPVYDDEEDDDITNLRDEISELVQSYTERMDNEGWDDARKYYTLGLVETSFLTAAATQEMLDWDDILNAKALMGDGEDIRRIQAQMIKADVAVDLENALVWAAEPADLADGLRHGGNLETSRALLAAGAAPSYNDGRLFFSVVNEGQRDIAAAFCIAGKEDSSFHLHYWNENKSSFVSGAEAQALMREMYFEYGLYERVDPSTLAERKRMSDGAQLRLIFDFAARRVSEIYTQDKHAFKTEVSFDDYGPAALERARAKLVELGGNPPADMGQTRPRGMIKGPLAAPAVPK